MYFLISVVALAFIVACLLAVLLVRGGVNFIVSKYFKTIRANDKNVSLHLILCVYEMLIIHICYVNFNKFDFCILTKLSQARSCYYNYTQYTNMGVQKLYAHWSMSIISENTQTVKILPLCSKSHTVHFYTHYYVVTCTTCIENKLTHLGHSFMQN